MTSKSSPTKPDPLAGYFSSVMLALLVSHTLATMLLDTVAGIIYVPAIDLWRYNVASGLFLGLVLADPVGAIITRVPWRNVLVKFVLGFALGFIIQVSLVTPFAGGGLSRFVFLFIATLLVPVFYSLNQLHSYLARHDTDLKTEVADYALWLLWFPDRLLIIVLMILAFTGFWALSLDAQTTILIRAVILALTTLYVVVVRVEAPDPWESILPEDEPLTALACARAYQLAVTLLPGALLLGASMHVAAEVLLTLFPNVAAQLVGPAETARTVGILAATGLGIVFFGMLAALGFGLGVLLLIGRIARWTQSTLRNRCLRLIKVMCFRPIDRAG